MVLCAAVSVMVCYTVVGKQGNCDVCFSQSYSLLQFG